MKEPISFFSFIIFFLFSLLHPFIFAAEEKEEDFPGKKMSTKDAIISELQAELKARKAENAKLKTLNNRLVSTLALQIELSRFSLLYNGLHIAAQKGYTNVIDTLCQHFATNYTDNCAHLLIEKEVMFVKNTQSGIENYNALHIAAEEGHAAACKALIAYYPLLATQITKANTLISMVYFIFNGMTPLHIAAYKGKVEVIEAFVNFYPKPVDLANQVVKRGVWTGYNALQIAKYFKHREAVAALSPYTKETSSPSILGKINLLLW